MFPERVTTLCKHLHYNRISFGSFFSNILNLGSKVFQSKIRSLIIAQVRLSITTYMFHKIMIFLSNSLLLVQKQVTLLRVLSSRSRLLVIIVIIFVQLSRFLSADLKSLTDNQVIAFISFIHSIRDPRVRFPTNLPALYSSPGIRFNA